MSFGSVLASLIDEFNITQKELSVALSTSAATISTYVMNTREPDLEMLKKIADYFHVSVDYLLEYENSQQRSDEEIAVKLIRGMSPGQKSLWIKQGKQLQGFDVRENEPSEGSSQA